MANITAQSSFANITVTENLANIVITDTDSGSNVNVTTTNSLINVSSTTTNVTVSEVATISNALTRRAFSVTDNTPADVNTSLTYSNINGVFTYTGIDTANIRSKLSASDAGGDGSFGYDSANGIFTYTGPSASEVRAHLSAENVTSNITVSVGTYFGGATGDRLLAFSNSIPRHLEDGDPIFLSGSTNANLSSINNTVFFAGNISTSSITLYTSFPSTPYVSGLGAEDAGGLTLESVDVNKGSLAYSNANGVFSYTGITNADFVSLAQLPLATSNSGSFEGEAVSPIQFYGYNGVDSQFFKTFIDNSYEQIGFKKGDLIFDSRFIDLHWQTNVIKRSSRGNDTSLKQTLTNPYDGWPNSDSGGKKVLTFATFDDVRGSAQYNNMPKGVQIAHGTIFDDIEVINLGQGIRVSSSREFTVTMVQDSTGGHDFDSGLYLNSNVTQTEANGYIHFVNDIKNLDTTPGAVNVVKFHWTNNITDGTATTNQEPNESPSVIIEIQRPDFPYSTINGNLAVTGNLTANYFLGNADLQTLTADDFNTANLTVTNSFVAENVTPSGGTFTVNGEGSITGNLVVGGNIDYTHVNDLYVANTEIVLNANSNVDSNVQITVNRPVGGSNAHLKWDEGSDRWLWKINTADEYEFVGINNSSNTFVINSNAEITTDKFTINQTSFGPGALDGGAFNLIGSSATNDHAKMFMGRSFGINIFGGDNIVTNHLGNIRGAFLQTTPVADTSMTIGVEIGNEAIANLKTSEGTYLGMLAVISSPWFVSPSLSTYISLTPVN